MLQGIHLLDLARDYRLTLPHAWLEQFPDSEAVVTVGHDPAWLIYPTATFEARTAAFAANPPFKLETRMPLSLMIGHAQVVRIDPRGRLRIPTELRSVLGTLTFPCSMRLVGFGDLAELWSAQQWELEMDTMVNALRPPWVQELMDNDPLM